ncbi:hypothetical protein FRB91_002917 [Serendipita sp. 411]|nr:hypothetical protein FRB91_002917 [Serendipita sp. 411]
MQLLRLFFFVLPAVQLSLAAPIPVPHHEKGMSNIHARSISSHSSFLEKRVHSDGQRSSSSSSSSSSTEHSSHSGSSNGQSTPPTSDDGHGNGPVVQGNPAAGAQNNPNHALHQQILAGMPAGLGQQANGPAAQHQHQAPAQHQQNQHQQNQHQQNQHQQGQHQQGQHQQGQH